MEEPLEAALLLLAGGQSRRMGRPKPLLEVAGTTLVEWVAGRLSPVFGEVMVSANDPALVPPGLARVARVVRDLHVGAGPLAGIEAGLAATSKPVVFAVACDMPLVTPELARRITLAAIGHDAAVPLVASRPEPACAAYATSMAGPIAAALAAGSRRAAAALEEADVVWISDLDPDELRNLNTPEDYRSFLDAVR